MAIDFSAFDQNVDVEQLAKDVANEPAAEFDEVIANRKARSNVVVTEEGKKRSTERYKSV